MMPAASNKTESKPSAEGGDITKAIANVLEKKIRNIEKRKSKLDAIRSKKDAGDTLEKEQQETLKNYDVVISGLDVVRDLQKSIFSVIAEEEKKQKKQMKREKQERAAFELKRTADMMKLRASLEILQTPNVRKHFLAGKHGAVVFSEHQLEVMEQLLQKITPPNVCDKHFETGLRTAAEHMVKLVEARPNEEFEFSYKDLHAMILDISNCGYFERSWLYGNLESEAQSDEEEQPRYPDESPSLEESFTEVTQTEVQNSPPVQQPASELVEEPPLPDNEPTVASHEAPAPQFVAPMAIAASAPMFPTQQMEAPPQPPIVKARPLAEIVSSVGGTFCFLQESEIDLDSPHIDPAVVAAQPMIRPSPAPSQQPPQSNMMPTGFPAPPLVDQSGDSEVQDPLSLSQQSMTNTDFGVASQSFAQASLSHSQNLSSGVADALFQSSVEETSPPSQQQHTSHSYGQPLGTGESVAQYDLPPSIPMPPSQTQQDGSQMTGQEKKFQLNASATEFQSRSMYSQMPPTLQNMSSQPPPPQNIPQQPPSQAQPPHQQTGHPDSRPVPPPSNADFTSAPNFAQAASDFTQSAGNFQSGNFQRGRGGGSGGFRGSRPNRGANNSGGGAMQNGFNNRPQNGNGRPGSRGGTSYQGYPPRNDYRPDGFQGYNTNGFGGPYQKRGGNGNGGPGFSRGGNNRGAGGMRGGMPRGGPPRGAGGNRGGMNHPGNQ